VSSLPLPQTIILQLNHKAGFWSNVNRVVNRLAHSIGQNGIAALRVDWYIGPAKPFWPYGTAVDGNLWEMYFEPIEFEMFPLVEKIVSGYANYQMTGLRAYYMYKTDRHWRARYHAAYTRYIRLKPFIQQQVTDFYQQQLAGKFCVGVHFRNSFHSPLECPEPNLPLGEYLSRTRAVLAHRSDGVVFLATDVAEAVDRFHDEFGDRLIYQPTVLRAQRDGDREAFGEHQPASFQAGLAVLLDCFLLAKCNALLHVTSNIATAAGYLNPDLKMIYCERSPAVGMLRYWQKLGNHFLTRRLKLGRSAR
jgi:hypothetical protein